MTSLRRAGIGGAVVVSTLAGIIIFKVSRLTWSDSHGWFSAIKHYVLAHVSRVVGKACFHTFITDSKDVEAVQAKVLTEILNQNRDVKLCRDLGLDIVMDVATFQKTCPLTEYSKYSAYLAKIEDGSDVCALTAKAPLILTSTFDIKSMSKAIYPLTEGLLHHFYKSRALVEERYCQDILDGITLQKSMKLIYLDPNETSSSGVRLLSRPIDLSFDPRFSYSNTTPAKAYQSSIQRRDMLFIHLVFGLMDRNLGFIEAPTADEVLDAMIFMQNNWVDLVASIRSGHFQLDSLEDSTRHHLNKLLRANTKRADELSTIFSQPSDHLIRQLWPELSSIFAITIGQYEGAFMTLQLKFGKSVRIFSPFYLDMEGLFGINVNPDHVDKVPNFVICPKNNFYEFQEEGLAGAPMLLLHQLETGKEYHLIITTRSGFYRYKTNHIILVKYKIHQLPVIKFCRIKEEVLTFQEGIKWDQYNFLRTLAKTLAHFDFDLVDYCVEELTNGTSKSEENTRMPSHSLFLEGLGGAPKERDQVGNKLKEIFEENHQNCGLKDVEFQVTFVGAGTFSKLRDNLSRKSNCDPFLIRIPKFNPGKDILSFLGNHIAHE